MGPSETMGCVDHLLIEKSLSESEILLRRAFVQKYMRNRNAYEACLELGFMQVYAQDWAQMFMGEGIVRRLIAQAEEEDEDSPEASRKRQRKYRAWLERQANYYGPGCSHGSRVSAITQLTRIEGMEAAAKTESEITYKGGVMVVPEMNDPDTWGEKALGSQEHLKKTVKD